jgi:outer membrane murein-binding lipoprotein Lpp
MGYAVLHLDKASGNEAKMTAHIERMQIPKNADPERTHLNRELIEFPNGMNNRTEAIQHRLDNAGITRKIGTNQVRAIRIMLTGSNEDMKRIEAEGKLDDWCNDNIDWLCKTYGTDNIVSAVLHLDEATPHIHATIVPIVTGERRKVKEKKKQEEQGGKKYRKKSPNAARLCADDVMTRIKLKEYQDSYANAMAKYGLKRGIEGSEARHITTQEFYRNAIAQQGSLQDNIVELLKIEESKRHTVENLKQKEQEAIAHYEQADTLKHQKEVELDKTQAELKGVKGQLKTEKFKSSAAEVGSTLMDGINSAFGTSKVKRQQQEIQNLDSENIELQAKVHSLTQQVQEQQTQHAAATYKLRQELDKIYALFPKIKELLRIENLCRHLGFGEDMAKNILEMKPIGFKGNLYSAEYKRHF